MVELRKIAAHEVRTGMVVLVDEREIAVQDTWEDQGEGLGVVVRGVDRKNGSWEFVRFVDPMKLVDAEIDTEEE